MILLATLLNGCMIAGTIIIKAPLQMMRYGKVAIAHFALPEAAPIVAPLNQFAIQKGINLNPIPLTIMLGSGLSENWIRT